MSYQTNDPFWKDGYNNGYQTPSTASADEAWRQEQGRLQRQREEQARIDKTWQEAMRPKNNSGNTSAGK
jgi:hypothetical protein